MSIESSKYWDSYYSKPYKLTKNECPSQFAVFIANELANHEQIIEIGCGSGRDAFFFIESGFKYLGLDNSESAIKQCLEKSKEYPVGKSEFVKADFSNKNLTIDNKNIIDFNKPVVLYGRFLLHAIDESSENIIFTNLIAKLQKGSRIAFEFRTLRDANLPKETSIHYRRYIDPLILINKGILNGLKIEYFVEGFGYAKWKNDDAHVARCVFNKI
jgi:SAM-dependent methyltransferase